MAKKKDFQISVRGIYYGVKAWILKGTPAAYAPTDVSKLTWKLMSESKPEKAEYLSVHDSQGNAVLWIEPRYYIAKIKTWEEFYVGKDINKIVKGPFSSIEEACEYAWK